MGCQKGPEVCRKQGEVWTACGQQSCEVRTACGQQSREVWTVCGQQSCNPQGLSWGRSSILLGQDSSVSGYRLGQPSTS